MSGFIDGTLFTQDRLELLDFLRAAKWDVNEAAKSVKSAAGSVDFVPDEKPKGAPAAAASSVKKGSGWKKPKLPSVKSHHAPEENNR